MMKHSLFFFLLLFIISGQTISQNTGKPAVSVASYFDISPPLRVMCLGTVKKTDQSWKNGAVKNYFTVTDHSGIEKHVTDSITQKSSGLNRGDSILLNFEGLTNLNWVVPPDPCGDVSPDHYFQMVNLSCAIYDKAGIRILGPFNSGSIWNGMPHNSSNGDGIVLYDENADRWFISQFSLPNFPNGPYYQMIAVSQTADPTGSWFRWEFSFSDIPDYPKFGIWPDGYYMSFNRIRSGGGAYDGTGAAAFDRTAMLNGDPTARMILFLLNSNNDAFSAIPADCDGEFPDTGTPEFFLFIQRNYLGSMEFHADWDNPSNSTYGNYLRIPVSPFVNLINNIPQQGTAIALTPINDRLMFRLQFRKFDDHQSMVVNHTVDVGQATGIRWYELRRTTENWYIYQQSTYSPDSNFRWMGSMAMDESGNIALGYSVSGTNLYPSIRYAGRMADDPLGQLTIAEREIIAGSGAQTGEWGGVGRWGDYSAMSVDPVNPKTFWYTQEYFDSTSVSKWTTRIASFSFANILMICAMALPPVICRGDSSRLNIETSGGTGNFSYEWSSIPPGFSSNEKDPIVTPVNTTTYIAMVIYGSAVCTDTITVEILPPAEVFSGNDSSYCLYVDRIPLQGRASDIISVEWTTSGDGRFSDETNLNTVYFPGIWDLTSASVNLKLIGLPQYPCSTVISVKHITFEPCAGIEESIPDSPTIEVFPNPARDQFFIRMVGFSSSPVWVRILDPIGEVVMSEVIPCFYSSQILKINSSKYSGGIFILKVKTDNQMVYRKIILQK
ncbi:MAG: T9SS type A sorting domain-containing protein [Bacteroidales bacterium]|jgi:hypothetical protein|nr:T9SS type A sorting domain-containing protein [Bacteroidales bacterium]